ncbi:oxygenase MpaB family protein [Tsukamurella tyrosinosolvens]|uniref:oxygenase MpaB family protein n=1 Tax=Tsukamurella tyrosinosolvens TaxID=57704 RepID=UPI001E4D8CF3|nr:oxygenase MpaB family protein [Tsukamurella tyrosinosolvens]
MAVIDQALIRSRRARRPETLADLMTMVGLTSGVANIIMQLSLPAVGHGVHESRVVSGSPRRRPFKRLRTTSQHLVVSVLGNESDRDAFREEMRAVHAHVHSTESSPVRYSGNARDLQLWVAACLFRFYIDQYELLYGPLDRAALDVLTPAAAPLATGVNVPESAWPQSWHEFEDYWDSMLPSLSIAPEVRDDLKSLSDFMFLHEALGAPGWVLARVFGPLNHFLTRGNLPSEFRDMLGWKWSEATVVRFAIPCLLILVPFWFIDTSVLNRATMTLPIFIPFVYFSIALNKIYRRGRLRHHGLDPELVDVIAREKEADLHAAYIAKHGPRDH